MDFIFVLIQRFVEKKDSDNREFNKNINKVLLKKIPLVELIDNHLNSTCIDINKVLLKKNPLVELINNHLSSTCIDVSFQHYVISFIYLFSLKKNYLYICKNIYNPKKIKER